MDGELAGLERRLRALEDERDIAHLIASYGPYVDAGAGDEVAGLWLDDGVYDVDEVRLDGRDAIATMVATDPHQGWIAGGYAHVLGPPAVTVDGDEAVAVCHSLMVVRDDGRFVVRRATANHWVLVRTPEGWRVRTRTSRLLDGRDASPRLLARGARGQHA